MALQNHNLDIVALSETQISGTTQYQEVQGGYTLFCIGKPEDEDRRSGVGFAIRSDLASSMKTLPKGINDHLMTLRLALDDNNFVTLVSVYAPTLNSTDDQKEAFYTDLRSILRSVPHRDTIIYFGDFNARVGSVFNNWDRF